MTTDGAVDVHLERAGAIVADARGPRPVVRPFFDADSFTASYVVHDPATLRTAVIDPVLGFDPATGRTSLACADKLIDYVREHGLKVDWLLETHIHADHLSAAPYIQDQLGGRLAIGAEVVSVRRTFGRIFNAGTELERDGADFDVLFADGDRFALGDVGCIALHAPGHTPADVAYVVGDAVFCGDTLFMPDSGTARADFPGGDARQLYRSIRRLLRLPELTRLFVCHDYKAPGRDDFAWETTVGDQRRANVHVHDGIGEDAFVATRTERDRSLAMPRLIIPAIQVNMRGGRLPSPEDNGLRYLRIPLDGL